MKRILISLFFLVFLSAASRSPGSATASELPQIQKRQSLELKKLKDHQVQAFRDWKKKEVAARHQYFEEHPKGAERRVYVQDFMKRRETFQHGQELELKALREAQSSELKK